MKKLRLFHFDIKTLGNYGDTLLFELTRQLFEAFGDRQAFEIAGALNLRSPMGPGTVDNINDNFDAILVGGGGLFLRDTNVNERSGWQWNCAIEQLRAFKKPIIVFAVGNNRFPGQEDFDPIFREHLNVLIEKCVFFGLRNTGSVRTIAEYIEPRFRDRIVLQPCPTTIAAELVPDLFEHNLEPAKRFAIQTSLEARHVAAGFDVAGIHARIADAVELLIKDGFSAEVIAHMPADEHIHKLLTERGHKLEKHEFYDRADFYAALRTYATLPITVGMRGHAQMIPFGMGNPIVSLMAHDKLRYFLEDIGHEELNVDVQDPELTQKLVSTVRHTHENFAQIRADFGHKRQAIFTRTMDNLGTIYERLTGEKAVGELRPLTRYERAVSTRAYHAILKKERLDRLLRAAKRETVAAERERDELSAKLKDKERELAELKTELGKTQTELEKNREETRALAARLQKLEDERLSARGVETAHDRDESTRAKVRGALRVASKIAEKVLRNER